LDVDVSHKERFSHRFVCGFAWFSPLMDTDESVWMGFRPPAP
jgi:hypothetical protein